jgi:hypothetical protein
MGPRHAWRDGRALARPHRRPHRRYTRDQAPIPARPTMTLWLAVISATMRSTSRPSARYGATVA